LGDLTPLGRSRVAFTALLLALYLIGADRTVATGDPVALYIYAPVLAVFGVGHASAQEALVRSTLSVGALVAASVIASLAHGRGLPFYANLPSFFTAVTGLFAFNLVLIFAASKLVQRIWPTSDHWTH